MDALHVVHDVLEATRHLRVTDVAQRGVVAALTSRARQQRLPAVVRRVVRPLLASAQHK